MRGKGAVLACLAVAALQTVWARGEDDFLGNAGDAGKAASAPVSGKALLTGKVFLDGKAPPPQPLGTINDTYCRNRYGAVLKDESVLQNADGTLQNVFLYVKEGAGDYPAPGRAVTVRTSCRYQPHVLGVQAGQKVVFVNNLPELDTVRCLASLNDGFNRVLTDKGSKFEVSFRRPEVMIKFLCDVHSWESAYVGVVENPFFNVTGTKGSYRITGLPAGTYLLEAWHEKYGVLDQAVTLTDGETRALDFHFKAP